MKLSGTFFILFFCNFHLHGQIVFEETFGLPGNQQTDAAIKSITGEFYILSQNDSGQNSSDDSFL